MWLNHKKHFWRKILFLFMGVGIGFLIVNQYKAQKEVARLTTRDSAVSFVNQLQLAVRSNRELHDEVQKLKLKMEDLRSGVNTRSEIQKSMSSYRLLSGLDAVYGEGLEVEIDLFLEPYWLIDLVNELFIGGAEKIALNGNIINDLTSFTSQDDVIYLNGKMMVSTPLKFQVIGNFEQIKKSLKRPGSIMARLSSGFPGFEADKSMTKVKEIILAPIN